MRSTILAKAQSAEWPQFFVDLRHQASHQAGCSGSAGIEGCLHFGRLFVLHAIQTRLRFRKDLGTSGSLFA